MKLHRGFPAWFAGLRRYTAVCPCERKVRRRNRLRDSGNSSAGHPLDLARRPPRALHHRPLRPPRQQHGDGRRRPGHARRHRHEALGARKSAASTTTRFSPALPAPPPTPSRSSPASKSKLEQYGGNLGRSAVELAKDWRTDKLLRQLQALLIVADAKQMFLLSGDGDVIEPDPVGKDGGLSPPSAPAAALPSPPRPR